MHYPEFSKEYIKTALSNPVYIDDFKKILNRTVEDRRLYKGTVIPMTYQGIFFTPRDIKLFKHIIKTMMSIGRKVTNEYVNNPAFRVGFHFDKALEELILIDQGDDMPVPVGRYDIFYEGDGKFKFCELNTDGSSAMNEDRVLSKILMDSKIFKDMGKDWDINSFELFDSLVVSFLDHYRKIRNKDAQVVALVDLLDKGTLPEFVEFKKTFEKGGVKTLICDVRELEYRQGRLWGRMAQIDYQESAKDKDEGTFFPIDLVYRRLVTSDFMEIRSKAAALEEAYRDKAILMMGGFRSQIMHAKTCFSVLHSEGVKNILSSEEIEFIKAHVPYTKELLDVDDKKTLVENKDDFILKPYNSYASQGILLGREHEQEEWEKIIENLPLDQYIYQEYVENNHSPVLEVEGDKFVESIMGHVIGLFSYCEEFAGSYTRFGKQGIISGARNYYSAPAFLVKRK